MSDTLTNRMIRIDMNDQSAMIEPFPEAWRLLGGRALGNGAAAIGSKQKHYRVAVIKGQALPAWDPRPLKAAGITYCTSAMGADHTAGLVVEPG